MNENAERVARGFARQRSTYRRELGDVLASQTDAEHRITFSFYIDECSSFAPSESVGDLVAHWREGRLMKMWDSGRVGRRTRPDF